MTYSTTTVVVEARKTTNPLPTIIAIATPISSPKRTSNLGSLSSLSDQLLCEELFPFFNPSDLLLASAISPVFYILCNEDTLWHTLCVINCGGDFTYTQNWKTTLLSKTSSFTPSPTFHSDYLFRRWYRSNVDLSVYLPDSQLVDIRQCSSLSFSDFTHVYEAPGFPVVLRGCLGLPKSLSLADLPQNIGFEISHTVRSKKGEGGGIS